MSADERELLSKVESLINLNIGDTPRLVHIKETLQSCHELYLSDKNYLHSLLAKTGLVDSQVNETNQFSDTPKEIPNTYSKVNDVHQSLEVPSKLWYIAHIFFSIVTGLICYILWKDKNPKMAKKHLILSIPLTFVPLTLILLLTFLSQLSFILS